MMLLRAQGPKTIVCEKKRLCMYVRVCVRAQISLGLGLIIPQPLHIQLYISQSH